MTTTTGRHARRGHAARKLILALGLMAGITVTAGAGTAAIVSLGSAPASVTVPGPSVHAAARAHHPAAVPLPKPHKAAQAVYVTVRAGQCLWTIARAHHVTWVGLYRVNRAMIGGNPNVIYPGMRLRVPARR